MRTEPRILNDALLGPVDLNALESRLNAVNASMTLAAGCETSPLARLDHFNNNGHQLYASIGNLFGTKPLAERLAAIARVTTGQQIILPPSVEVVACGARLCLSVH